MIGLLIMIFGVLVYVAASLDEMSSSSKKIAQELQWIRHELQKMSGSSR